MNEEIKEILDNLNPKYDIVDEFGNDYKKVKFKDCKLLLNYITNLQEENQKLVKELDTLRGRIITFINVFQDEKTLGLSYSDLKHLRGIVNNNKFDIKVLDDKLTELKGGSDEKVESEE